MSILAILIGLAISHYATGVRQLRRYDLALAPAHWVHRFSPELPWLVMITLILTCLIAAALAEWLLIGLAATFGWFLLALFVFIYCLGPRDLDKDVELLTDRGLEGRDSEVSGALNALHLTSGATASEAASAVHHAALSRWFGLLFWFVVLGIPGALLYRLTRAALQDEFDPASLDWLARLRRILDWPVLALMALSAALCSDLDRVVDAWRRQPQTSAIWGVSPLLLDRIAAVNLTSTMTRTDALVAAHRLVWRMLILWLVAMSLILIAGWIV